jgi:accessory gene regulator B
MFAPSYLSKKISYQVVHFNPQFQKKQDIIRYGLEWLIGGINQVLLVTLCGAFLNILPEVMICLVGGALLRTFSGGSHFSGYYKCLFISTFQIIAISQLSSNLDGLLSKEWIYYLCLSYSVLMVWIYAPRLNKKKDLFSQRKKRITKIISIIILLLYVLISEWVLNPSLITALWISVVLQAYSLTNSAHKLNNKIENILERK